MIFEILIFLAFTFLLCITGLIYYIRSHSLPPADPKNLIYMCPLKPTDGSLTQMVRNFLLYHLDQIKERTIREHYEFNLECAAEARRLGKKHMHMVFGPAVPRLIPLDEKDIGYILTRPSVFPKGESPYLSLELFALAGGIFSERDEEQAALRRRLINPCFTPKVLKVLSDLYFTKNVQEYCDKIEKQQEESTVLKEGTIEELTDELTRKILTESAFRQSSVSSKIEHDFSEISDHTFEHLMYLLLPPSLRDILCFFSASSRQIVAKFVSLSTGIRDYAREIITNIRESKEERHEVKAIVDVLAFEQELPEEVAATIAYQLLIAGHETTSRSIAWAIYFLAHHQEVQQKLFEELCDFVSPQAAPTIEDIDNIKYLENVIKESLRLRPVVPSFSRTASKDDTLPSGLVVKKGTIFAIQSILTQTNPEIYGPDVMKYRPERWEDPETLAKVTMYSFMPHAAGSRRCPGDRYSIIEMKIAIAAVVRRFHIETSGETEEERRFPPRFASFTVKPSPSKKLKFTKTTIFSSGTATSTTTAVSLSKLNNLFPSVASLRE